MFQHHYLNKFTKITAIGISTAIAGTSISLEAFFPRKTLSSPSFLEYRWDDTGNYRKLYYSQSSGMKGDRSTYHLIVRAKDRKTAILKLSINFPKSFKANITPKKLSLCKVKVGSMLERTKCIEKVPAIFEVSNKKTTIEVFPRQPIPTEDSYAVVMKIFNPYKSGMFQVNALAQAPGDVPISGYIGSWSIDID